MSKQLTEQNEESGSATCFGEVHQNIYKGANCAPVQWYWMNVSWAESQTKGEVTRAALNITQQCLKKSKT